jgi:hypothetical protein
MDTPSPASPGTSGTLPGQERRRELRIRPEGGTVLVDGIPCDIVDWSSSGLSAHGYIGSLTAGDRARVSVRVTAGGRPFSFDCDLILLRVDPDRQFIAGVFAAMERGNRVAIALHFEQVEAAANDRLRAAITGRVPGGAAPAG